MMMMIKKIIMIIKKLLGLLKVVKNKNLLGEYKVG